MTTGFREALATEQGLAAFRHQIEEQAGVEAKVVDELATVYPRSYLRTAVFTNRTAS